MLKKIGIGILLVLPVIVGLAFTKPDSFSLERSTTINAPADSIFPHLNDFHNWGAWSPWEKLDPAMTRTHSGAASGPGARPSASSDRRVAQVQSAPRRRCQSLGQSLGRVRACHSLHRTRRMGAVLRPMAAA